MGFVVGGASIIPPALAGTRHAGMLHICDWFATLARLVGQPSGDSRAPASVPAVDSLDVWDSILGGGAVASPRVELPLHVTDHCYNASNHSFASCALIVGDMKIVTGYTDSLG